MSNRSHAVEDSRYGIRTVVAAPYTEAVARTTAALKAEGFGVLTTIDVQHTLKTKVGRDFRPYVILGACNPPLADKAFTADLEVGLLLPCNVVVYRTGGKTRVSAVAAEQMLGMVGNEALQPVAAEVAARLRRVLDSIASG